MERVLAAIVRLVTGCQARWVGCEPELRPRVYFANHTSHLDFLVVWAALPPDLRAVTRPVAGRDYWLKTRLRAFLAQRVFKAVLIEREHVSRASNPLPALLDVAARGLSLLVFPEGTRGSGGAVGPFKGGLHHLWRRLPDRQFVPVYLENLNRILPKGEVLPLPLIGSATFGPPLEAEAEESKQEFLGRAREAVIALGQP